MLPQDDTLRFRLRAIAALAVLGALLVIGGFCVALASTVARNTPEFGQRGATLAEAHISPVENVVAGPTGLRMTNLPAEAIAVFNRHGASVRQGGGAISLRLSALGHGARMFPILPVTPARDGDRIDYRRGVVSEWFFDGPAGVEAGLLMIRPPAEGRGPLTFRYSVGGAPSRTVEGGHGVSLGGPGGPTVAYRDLRASDSLGRRVSSWFTVHGGGFQLHIEDHGHSYPLSVDPTMEIE